MTPSFESSAQPSQAFLHTIVANYIARDSRYQVMFLMLDALTVLEQLA